MSGKDDSGYRVGPYVSLGMQLAGGMVVFVALGYWADRWLSTDPWLLLVGATLGMVTVFVRIAYLR